MSIRALAAVLIMIGPIGGSVTADFFYALNSGQSLSLTVSGSAFGEALNVTQQHPNVITTYNGHFYGQVPSDRGSILFTGGDLEALPATVSGSPRQFSPNIGGGTGSAHANYGVNVGAAVGIEVPPIEIPDLGTLNLGTLQSINFAIALREMVLALESSAPLAIGPGGVFDASGIDFNVQGGFADVNGSFLFQQPDLNSHFSAVLALNALALAYPELGLTVSSSFLNRTVTLRLGTRLDLNDIGGTSVPNDPEADGLFSTNEAVSLVTLPVHIDLPSLEKFGIPSDFLVLNMRLSGQLTATAKVPEPSSLALSAFCALGIGFVAHRRRTGRKSRQLSLTVSA